MFSKKLIIAGLAIAIGAIPGALLRYLILVLFKSYLGMGNTYFATLLVNLVGCFIIAFFLTLAEAKQEWPPEVKLVVSTGFCGSLTTFSTYSLETVNFLTQGHWLLAFLYSGGSVVTGLVAVLLGEVMARRRLAAREYND